MTMPRPTLRWVKPPVSPAGCCKHCGGLTVRVRGLTPVPRDEKLRRCLTTLEEPK